MSTEAMRASMILVDGVPIREHEERESLKQFEPEVDMALDVGIRDAVCILRRAGVETYESCDGSGGHTASRNRRSGFTAVSPPRIARSRQRPRAG